ncbi:MAG TPA: hypothetical protein VIX80_02285 [Candidatus Kapabacteria bacterium]
MSRPLYINRGGELVFAPPFVAKDVHQYSFVIDADITKLQGVCDKYLNAPLGGAQRFIPGGPFLLLSCCDLPSLTSLTAPYSTMGWFAEKEIAFWMPVMDTVQKRLFWMLPYIWVDNPYAMAMGRELYGFPKGIGTVTLPASSDSPDLFAIDAFGIKKFSPDEKGEILRLVEVKKVPGVKEGISIAGAFTDLDEIMKTIIGYLHDGLSLLGNAKMMFNSIDDMVHAHIPMVFLKEIRDAAEPDYAAFQAIVEVSAVGTNFHGGAIYSDAYDINIEICDSHPIRTELGLAASGPIRSKLSFVIQFDFQIGMGTQTIVS